MRVLVKKAPMKRVVVMVALAAYVFVGAAHGLCGLDLTQPSGVAAISLADEGAGHADEGVVADHHCHGCFAVMLTEAAAVAAADVLESGVPVAGEANRYGRSHGIDPPRPKILT